MRANSAANIWSSLIPARHFTDTGFPLFLQARMMAEALGMSSIRALPSPLLNTLGTGQPILMSIKSKCSSSGLLAICSMTAGDPPRSWTALRGSSSVVNRRRPVARSWYFRALALTISVKHRPAPIS